MVEVAERPTATHKSQDLGNFLNLNPGAITKTEQKGNLLRLCPKIHENMRIPRLEAENGHIIFICLQRRTSHE